MYWRITLTLFLGTFLPALKTANAAEPSAKPGNGSEAVLRRDAVLSLMHKVNDWQQAHPRKTADNDWVRGTWYTGVVAAYKATGDERFLRQALAWGQRYQWRVNSKLFAAGTLICADAWLELHFITKDKAMLEPTVNWLATPADNTPAGANARWYGFPIRYGLRDLVFVDSLYGAPALAMLAKATGDSKYLDILHRYFWDVAGELYDKDSNLFYRDRRFIDTGPEHRTIGYEAGLRRFGGRLNVAYTQTKRGKKVLWSRGNGWAIAGLSLILQYLPETDPVRPRYVQMFRDMSAELAKRQGADGLWRTNLDDPDDFPMQETSGTGFFCYGLAWGINHGLLDRDTYLPIVRKAWAGLVRCVSTEGKVQWGQVEAGWPETVRQEDTDEYVAGAFLLAGSEVYRLSDQ